MSVAEGTLTAPSSTASPVLDVARRFAEDRLRPFARTWEEAAGFPHDVLLEAADLGFAGLYVPREFGGSEMAVSDAARVFEGLGYGDPSFAGYLSVHNMCGRIIAEYGSEEQRAQYLPRLAAMEMQASYCLTESNGGSDPSALRTRAVRSGDNYVINGNKCFITGAADAGVHLVVCRTIEERTLLLLVPGGTAGLSWGESEAKMGWRTQPTREVHFSDVCTPVSARLGTEGDGLRIAFSGLNAGRLNIAAASLGAAQWCLDRSISYSQERETYGRTLSNHQVIRFKIAEMEMLLQTARAVLYDAARRGEVQDPGFAHFAAIAKAVVTESAFRVIDEALQIHGGYGYIAGCGIEKMLRDVRVHRILEGTNEMMRIIVARSILGRETYR